MAANDAVIVGVGVMTAVGLSAEETAAAVHAGVMRFTETSIMDRHFQPVTLAEVPEEGLPALAEALHGPGPTAREVRLLRLATLPLRACSADLPQNARPVPLAIALPEMKTTRPLDTEWLVRGLALQVPDLIDPSRSDAQFHGRAGGVMAIGSAADIVRSGQADFVIAGGVDTYRDLYILATLDRERRLKTADAMDGFIPGEGSGFLLIARSEAAARIGLPVLATIAACAGGIETGHMYADEPHRGEGLAGTVQQAVATASPFLPVRRVFASLNGENHWAREWGVSHVRNQSAFAEDHSFDHPADCFGDIGAAFGPVATGLAALDSSAGVPGTTLVYGSSDHGQRAALILASAAGA